MNPDWAKLKKKRKTPKLSEEKMKRQPKKNHPAASTSIFTRGEHRIAAAIENLFPIPMNKRKDCTNLVGLL